MNSRLFVAASMLLMSSLVLGGCEPAGPDVRIINPYAEVDWATFGQYKADFHVHTTESDGKLLPATQMDKYRAAGFKVLAITDHNKVTYPWAKFGREEKEMGMVGVRACELSIHHHMNSFFVDTAMTLSERDALVDVGAKGGLILFNHPYWTPDGDGKPADWYIEFFRRYNHLIGMETADPSAWDACLARLMPDRPVWGFLNSDTHEGPLNTWSTLLLPSLDQAQVKRALEKGHFYSCSVGKSKFSPTVQSVRVDETAETITIQGKDYGKIVWIANGKHVHEGETLDCHILPANATYVRAELIPAGGGALTRLNPFGIVRRGTRRVSYPPQGPAYWTVQRDKLCEQTRQEINRQRQESAYSLAEKVPSGGWEMIKLAAFANRPLTGPDGWLGKQAPGPTGNLYHIAPGRFEVYGVPFRIVNQKYNQDRSVLCLRSKTFPTSLGKETPASVTIPVDAQCKSVYVLHGASYISGAEKIGRYRFIYNDGSSESVDIIARGKGVRADGTSDPKAREANIQDWWPTNFQFSNGPARKVTLVAENNPLDVRYLYVLEWRNPHPEKVVKEIELASQSEGKAGLMVLAITARLSQ